MQSKYDANKQRYPDARASEPAFTSYLTEQNAQYQFFTQAYHDTVAHIAAPLFGWNAAKIQERINIRDCARFITTLMNALEETKQCVFWDFHHTSFTSPTHHPFRTMLRDCFQVTGVHTNINQHTVTKPASAAMSDPGIMPSLSDKAVILQDKWDPEALITALNTHQKATLEDFCIKAYNHAVGHIAASAFGWSESKILKNINTDERDRFVNGLMSHLQKGNYRLSEDLFTRHPATKAHQHFFTSLIDYFQITGQYNTPNTPRVTIAANTAMQDQSATSGLTEMSITLKTDLSPLSKTSSIFFERLIKTLNIPEKHISR